MAKKTSKKTAKKKVSKKKPKKASASGGGDGFDEVLPELPPHDPPVPLESLVGQEQAIAMLRASIDSGRLHHGWIFHGPWGVGKFTAALAFAAILLDPTSESDLSGVVNPDPESRVQELLRTASHPDLHIVRKELARFSDDAKVRNQKMTTIAKDVIDKRLVLPSQLAATVTPGGLVSKVFIVDEAELIDPTVSNTLLKTLEEPPAGTVIILVTSSEDRLLPTIRSRCQRVAFAPLSDSDLRSWADGRKLDAAKDWDRLAMLAAGSPGRLLDAIETGVAAWPGELDTGLSAADAGRFDPLLGPKMAELVDRWAAARVEAEPSRGKDAMNRQAASRMLGFVAERARLRLGVAGDIAVKQIDAVQAAESRIRRNLQMPVVFDALVAELAAAAE
ncbi:MAG: hypothetical protein AAGI17_03430 [Planctomycetota bacterium]